MAEGDVDDLVSASGYGIVIDPVFFVHSARSSSAIDFYKAVFGAEEVETQTHPYYAGVHVSADLKIGSKVVCHLGFIGQEEEEDEEFTIYPDFKVGWKACIYPDDIKGLIKKATDNGAELASKAPQGFDYKVIDPIGNIWFVGSLTKKKKPVHQASSSGSGTFK